MFLAKGDSKQGADTGSVPPLNTVWHKHHKPALVEQHFLNLGSKITLATVCFARQIQYLLKHYLYEKCKIIQQHLQHCRGRVGIEGSLFESRVTLM